MVLRNRSVSLLAVALFGAMVSGVLLANEDVRVARPDESIARDDGSDSELKRGQDVMRDLEHMNSAEFRRIDALAYRGERMAFIGRMAPPGGTNDLVTGNGFYIRVINPKGEDLHPNHSAMCIALIRGRILQVFPLNKIIVIEVDKNDWKILMGS